MNESAPAPTEAAPKKVGRRDVVARLRAALDLADPGALATLRRANPLSPPAAFYRLAGAVLDDYFANIAESGPLRDEIESRWVVILSAMATAKDFVAGVPFGEALAKAGVAEMRVTRLLEAQPAQVPDLLRTLVHQLVQKGQPFDPNDLAELVLTAGTEHEHGSRRRIARSFYRHQGT